MPHPTLRDILTFLDVEDSMSLNCAMTNHDARPHLIAFLQWTRTRPVAMMVRLSCMQWLRRVIWRW